MGTAAARAALDDAGMDPQDIDLIVLATSTPDQTFPATAVTIQADLGITQGAAFDVQAVCSGFVFALTTADNYLKSGEFRRALVIGSEAFSRILDWDDRGTCVLFGDGAGALVVEAQKQNGSTTDRGVLASCLRSDGRYRDKLYVDGGPSTTGTVGYVRMDGPEVFRHAVTNIAEVIAATLKKSGYQASDIDWFVPHQANKRILDGAARKLGLAPENDRDHRGQARQYQRRLHPPGARHRLPGRAHQKGRSRADGGHGRGLYLGGGFGPLVNSAENCRAEATPPSKMMQYQEFDCCSD